VAAVRRWLLRLARSRVAGLFVQWAFTHMSDVLPVKRLCETDTLIAFPHPQPSYPTHILLVPKRPYASLAALPAEDTAFMRDLLVTVQDLVCDLGLDRGGYRLLVNGGHYQDVPHLHFHLISDQAPAWDAGLRTGRRDAGLRTGPRDGGQRVGQQDSE
jgi:histidine triad (HIT) family protein